VKPELLSPAWFLVALLALPHLAPAAGLPGAAAPDPDWRELVKNGQLVEIAKIDPGIRIELRYATTRNAAGVALHPPDFPCLVRPATAQKLLAAQRTLLASGRGLKIWDAYRPLSVQRELWRRVQKRGYVANLESGPPGRAAFHCEGLAVDVTLVDAATGAELPLPTDFDVFTADARGIYRGPNPEIKTNLRLLHHAMVQAGFLAQFREWWHFTARDRRRFPPLAKAHKR
jgi:D-alanyl-D-alanine dipeptidase